MAESLREYNPEVSEFKITHKASVRGVSRTTKSPKRKQPSLAHIEHQWEEFLEQQNPQKRSRRSSAHLFASQYTWLIMIRCNWPKNSCSQLAMKSMIC